MKKPSIFGLLLVILIGTLIFKFTLVIYADSPPGTGNDNSTDIEVATLNPVVTESGFINLSIDGLGTNNAAGGIIQAEKPTGATVRNAFLAVATTGFLNRTLVNGDVQVNGVGVNWSASSPSSIGSFNYWADVTSIVSPTINAAPPGRIDFTITEVGTREIGGEILAVVFDDPNQTVTKTVVLLFGAQNVNGDTFAINLVDPIDTTDPNLVIDMSLGISYGFQSTSVLDQFSQVNVNNVRLSSAAGGQDDGMNDNGALLTVGGLDDSNANPPAPLAGPTGDPRVDDELYNLIPFVSNGDTMVNVFTSNPSNDDNIFFTAFSLTGEATVTVQPPLPPPAPPSTSSENKSPRQDSGPHVPEPTTIALVSLGVAGLAGYVRHKRRNKTNDDLSLN